MAGEKQAALDLLDAELGTKNHAELNADPGINLATIVAQLRAIIVTITEA